MIPISWYITPICFIGFTISLWYDNFMLTTIFGIGLGVCANMIEHGY